MVSAALAGGEEAEVIRRELAARRAGTEALVRCRLERAPRGGRPARRAGPGGLRALRGDVAARHLRASRRRSDARGTGPRGGNGLARVAGVGSCRVPAAAATMGRFRPPAAGLAAFQIRERDAGAPRRHRHEPARAQQPVLRLRAGGALRPDGAMLRDADGGVHAARLRLGGEGDVRAVHSVRSGWATG